MDTGEEENKSGDTITETYFDYTGKPVIGELGFVTRIQRFSKKKLVSESWYDAEGNPMAIGDETYCRVDYTYYPSGNIKTEKYYDAEGQPVRCLRGYAIIYRDYDALNRVVYEKFYDTDGFAIMLPEGAVSYRYEYDTDGNLVKTTAYDYFDHEIQQ